VLEELPWALNVTFLGWYIWSNAFPTKMAHLKSNWLGLGMLLAVFSVLGSYSHTDGSGPVRIGFGLGKGPFTVFEIIRWLYFYGTFVEFEFELLEMYLSCRRRRE
jgi:hypothetical protein